MADKPTTPPPAYFLSLSLENVRSFGAKQTISFARPDGRPAQWTIILGDNGVGKTTVLKALAMLRPIIFIQDEAYSPAFTWRNAKKWLPNRNNGQPPSYLEFEAQTGYLLVKNKKPISSDDKQSFGMTTPVSSITSKINGKDVVEIINGSVGYSQFNYKLGKLVCYGYGAGRTVGNSTIAETPEAVDTCSSLFDDRADLLNPEEWFLNIDYGSKLAGENASQLNKARDLVESMLKTVLVGVEDIRIASTGTPQKPQISLQFLLFNTWVRLRDMSLGYQTLVVWLTDFASKLFIRYPDSPNPLEEPAIVLIDEIDLHLHPSWQRKLIGFLSGIFKNTQFIATAHSPLVVQAATDADANVVLLKREGDQTKVYQGRDLPDVHYWRLEQILSSELFDDTPPLSPQAEADLKRRNELLLKKRLTAKDKADLERLNAAVAEQPVGTTRPERRAEDLLAQLARNLGQSDLLE